MQLTLRVLYEDYIACKNWWTKSNMGLPLQKYIGDYIKLYKSNQTNYIALISTCPPFKVTKKHLLFHTTKQNAYKQTKNYST